MARNVVTLHRWGTSHALVIPRHIIKQIGWRTGDLLHIEATADSITYRIVQMPPGCKGAADQPLRIEAR